MHMAFIYRYSMQQHASVCMLLRFKALVKGEEVQQQSPHLLQASSLMCQEFGMLDSLAISCSMSAASSSQLPIGGMKHHVAGFLVR